MQPGSKIIGDTGGGRIAYDGRNEAWMDSKDTDPSAIRLGSPIGPDGGGGGKYNSDVLLDATDPDGKRIELGFVRITQNEYRRGHLDDFSAMIQIFLRDERIPEGADGNADPKYIPMLVGYAGDTKGHPALELHPAWADALRALIGNPGSAAPAGPSARVSRFYTGGGRFCIGWQDDFDTGSDPKHSGGGLDYSAKTGRVRAITYRCMPTTDHPSIDPNNESTWVAVSETVFA